MIAAPPPIRSTALLRHVSRGEALIAPRGASRQNCRSGAARKWPSGWRMRGLSHLRALSHLTGGNGGIGDLEYEVSDIGPAEAHPPQSWRTDYKSSANRGLKHLRINPPTHRRRIPRRLSATLGAPCSRLLRWGARRGVRVIRHSSYRHPALCELGEGSHGQLPLPPW